jgi:hypothetical protein
LEVVREVMHGVDEWKGKADGEGLQTTKRIALPKSLWLLNLIDYMKKESLIAKGPQQL